MTAFEVMGEHWWVTFVLGCGTIAATFRICDLIQEGFKEKTRRLHASTRVTEECKTLDLMEGSCTRLQAMERDGWTREQMATERDIHHRLQIALGWRTDPPPPPFAVLRANAEQEERMRELFARQPGSRARSAFVEMGSQAHPGRPIVALPPRSNETSVDTLAGRGAGSENDSMEPPNDPSSHPRNRRRNIRLPG